MEIKCAMLSGDIVSNIIIVNDIEQSQKDLNCELIEFTENNPAGIGYIYNRKTNTFLNPEEI